MFDEQSVVWREFVDRFRHDTPGFVRWCWGVEPDEWQEEVMRAVDAGERQIAVRSGHGVGKTSAVSWIGLTKVLFHPSTKVVVTAPSGPQLWDALFAEMNRWGKSMRPEMQGLLEFKADRIVLVAAPEENFITARTSRAETPEAFQGIHADNVVLIGDEASAIPEQVFEAGAGSMSGENCTTLLLGNPTRTSGLFFEVFHRLRDKWRTFHVSCVDVAARNPLRVSPKFIEEMKDRYGEDSNAFRVRVLGEFPRRDDDVLISFDLAMAARQRDVEPSPVAVRVWGVDVARFGSDASALCERRGNVVERPVKSWRGLDLMQLCGAIKHEYDARPVEERPLEINVDVIGLGAGVVDRLRELGLPVFGINVSESPAVGSFVNLRAELWDKARAWIEALDCRLPDDDDLVAELTTPRYTFASNGKLQLESKDAMRRRGVRSPDKADSFVLTFARDAILASGKGRGGWDKPLKRNLKGVI